MFRIDDFLCFRAFYIFFLFIIIKLDFKHAYNFNRLVYYDKLLCILPLR